MNIVKGINAIIDGRIQERKRSYIRDKIKVTNGEMSNKKTLKNLSY